MLPQDPNPQQRFEKNCFGVWKRITKVLILERAIILVCKWSNWQRNCFIYSLTDMKQLRAGSFIPFVSCSKIKVQFSQTENLKLKNIFSQAVMDKHWHTHLKISDRRGKSKWKITLTPKAKDYLNCFKYKQHRKLTGPNVAFTVLLAQNSS